MQGLVSVEALEKASSLSRERGRSPLKELEAWGILGPEEVEDLASQLEAHETPVASAASLPGELPTALGSGTGTQPSPLSSHTSGLSWPSPVSSSGAEARSVLEALRVPAWKQYRDLRFLGQGGMGRIFRAFDPALKRAVALKFLGREEPERMTRFFMEAQHQAKVDHPNICKVYEVGDWQGQPYIAMQFIRGKNLAAAQAELTLDEIVRTLETVAEAVHAAHACGLVHRDLKPANIMVERTERELTPFVLDFGLARGQEASGLTVQGLVIGTAGYMAPEQALGIDDNVRFPADIYALGATLYALLGGGQPPFAACTGLELLRRTVDEEPLPLRKLRPDLPRDLEIIVQKCLEKQPERRYPSALALAADLRRFREGEPILAHAPSLAYTLGKRARKHKVLVTVSALALAAVASFAGMGIQARRTAATRALWAQRYGQEAERLEALLRYAHLLPVHAIQGELDQVRTRMAQMEATVAHAPSAVVGPAAYALGRGYLAMGDVAAARSHLDRALASGLRTPEVYHVYGRTLGLQFQAELDRIRRIPDPAVRKVREHMAEHQLRDVGLKYLEQGKEATLDPPEYDKALLAFYGRRFEEALAAARRAFGQSPWFYEAKELEGEILLEQASGSPASSEGPQLLAAAVACFQEARTLAPSDPGLYEQEAKAWRQAMDQGWYKGEDPRGPCEHGLVLLEQERKVDAGRAEIQALAAWFRLGSARFLNNHGQDIKACLEQALLATQEALQRNPSNLEALQARMMAFGLLANNKWYYAGQDPLPDFALAVEAGQKAMAVVANDPLILVALSKTYLQIMAYKAGLGLDYRPPWEAAKTLMEQGVVAFPEVAGFHLMLGEVLVEWANQDQIHDRDPSPAIRDACKALERALQLEPESTYALYYLGVAHMVLAEYQLAGKADPLPALGKAVTYMTRAHQAKPDNLSCLHDLTQCHIDRSQAFLAKGESPLEELKAAQAVNRQAMRLSPTNPYQDYQEAMCTLVEIQWLARRKGPLDRKLLLFPRAEAQLRRWLKASDNQFARAQLAELYEWWALAGNTQAVTLGIAAARKAVTMDPTFGRGYFRLGSLEALSAKAGGPGKDEALAAAKAAFARVLELDPLLQDESRRRLNGL